MLTYYFLENEEKMDFFFICKFCQESAKFDLCNLSLPCKNVLSGLVKNSHLVLNE